MPALLTGALALARGAYFIAAMLMFGGTALRMLMRARLPHIAGLQMAWLAWAAAPLAAMAASLWFALAAAQMAGDANAALDGATLVQAGLHTLFGWGFGVRMTALLLAAIALAGGSDGLALAASAIALAAPALTGHAAASSPAHFAGFGIAIDSVHLLTAGFWLGGLAGLAVLFGRRSPKADLALTLGLFSEWAMVAVLLLAMTGLINSALVLLGEPGAVSAFYLSVLGLKLSCVAAMLVLAVINRFRLSPKLTGDGEAPLRRNIAFELGLGIAVAALAGLLGQLAPTLG